MDILDDFDFISWCFTFMDSDYIICSSCGTEIEIDEIQGSPNNKGDHIICPNCNEKISKEDIEKNK